MRKDGEETTADQSSSRTQQRTGLRWGGLVTAAIPALGYAIVYAHEWGYLGRFSIPAIFMTIDLMTVLKVSIALAGATLFLFIPANLVSMLWPDGRRLTRRGLEAIRDASLSALGGALFFIWPERRIYAWLFLSAGIFFAFLDFVFPILVAPGRAGYREKLQHVDAADDKTRSIFDRIAAIGGWGVLLIMIAAITLPSAAYLRGLYTADKRQEFLSFRSQGRTALVIREYHDRMICAYADLEIAQLQESFFVIPVPMDPPVELVAVRIGPLRTTDPADSENTILNSPSDASQ